jgi:predicted transcriptional regulator
MGLLTIQTEDKKNSYETTAKGEKYLEKYKDIASMLGDNEDD